jgi:chorismate--pyruvate lyase
MAVSGARVRERPRGTPSPTRGSIATAARARPRNIAATAARHAPGAARGPARGGPGSRDALRVPPRVAGWPERPLGAAALRGWLGDRGSLTRRLREVSRQLVVQRLRQGRGRPCPDEVAALLPRPGRPTCPRPTGWLVRDVALLSDGVPAVYAHSVIDAEALRGPWRWLAGLGNRPLGEALFRDPRIRRGAMAYRQLRGADPRYRAAVALLRAPGSPPPARVWARRSVFSAGGRRLLVTEVFLPVVASLRRPGRRAD